MNSTHGLLTVTPVPAFAATYDAFQVADIAAAMAERHEFPYEYTYLGVGSRYWSDQAEMSTADSASSDPTPWLIATHAAEVVALLRPGRAARVVDLGPGTGSGVHGLMAYLSIVDRLDSYRAVDISPDLLAMSARRLRGAFPDAVGRIHVHEGDFTGEALDVAMSRGTDRIVVIAGGTLHNLRDPDLLLRRVAARSDRTDLLMVTLRVEPESGLPEFMRRVHTGRTLKPQKRLGLDLCGIDPAWYDTELGYNPVARELFTRVRLLRPVDVVFEGRTARFAAGDTVTVWRYRYLTAADVERQLGHAGWTVRLRIIAPPGGRTGVAAGDHVLFVATPVRQCVSGTGT
ncbi:L-histidine N(alpha)-methyltransferase [Mangrovihabitans endophyticus]|uniref:Histidine-specific methyltransferase SAM-dependent domain-containing protein n=1 Tax=Mangrovihabitans endophyticus TaxID=1751298 RepID=A0A8J3BWS3_9ACTN|nr:L-histidine N(alpha)-methyltransferase [Mangrovihabitans endophyticus]GGK81703.1 hypothetical protein GCM10012284_14670 [Mangrovihabitans endophyticus]